MERTTRDKKHGFKFEFDFDLRNKISRKLGK